MLRRTRSLYEFGVIHTFTALAGVRRFADRNLAERSLWTCGAACALCMRFTPGTGEVPTQP